MRHGEQLKKRLLETSEARRLRDPLLHLNCVQTSAAFVN
jgi:hypothetical protein